MHKNPNSQLNPNSNPNSNPKSDSNPKSKTNQNRKSNSGSESDSESGSEFKTESASEFEPRFVRFPQEPVADLQEEAPPLPLLLRRQCASRPWDRSTPFRKGRGSHRRVPSHLKGRFHKGSIGGEDRRAAFAHPAALFLGGGGGRCLGSHLRRGEGLICHTPNCFAYETHRGD